MTRIGDSTSVTPTRTSEVSDVAAEKNICEAQPNQQDATLPEVQRSRATARPSVTIAARGDKARAAQLTALQTLGARLSSDLASNVLRSSDLIDTAHGSLGRASHQFSPAHADERALCKELQGWAENALSDDVPKVSAESLVLTRFPDFHSASHGAFKALARAMDKAIAARPKEAEQNAKMRGFVLGQHSDPASVAEKAGKDASIIVGVAVSLAAPSVGVLLALRDLTGLIRQRLNGQEASKLEIVGEGAAAFPALRIGKNAIKAAPAAIAEAAELSTMVRVGFQKIAEAGKPEAAKRLTAAVRELMVLRAELIARLEAVVADPATNRVAKSAVEKALHSILINGKAEDVVGALRDLHKVPVWDASKARFFDHLREVRNHAEALLGVRQVIFKQMGRKEEIWVQVMDDLKVYSEEVIVLLRNAL